MARAGRKARAAAAAAAVPAAATSEPAPALPGGTAPMMASVAGLVVRARPAAMSVIAASDLRRSRQLPDHRRQRDVDDRVIHHHQQHAQAQHRQDPPAPALNIDASRAGDAHGPAPAAAVVVTRPQCPAGRPGRSWEVCHGIAPFRVRRLMAAGPGRSRVVKTKLAAQAPLSAPPGGRCWYGCHGVLITGLQWSPGGGLLLQEVPPGAARFIGDHRPGRMAAGPGCLMPPAGAARIRSAGWPAG